MIPSPIELTDRLPEIETNLFLELKAVCSEYLESGKSSFPEDVDKVIGWEDCEGEKTDLDNLVDTFAPCDLQIVHEIWFFHFNEVVAAFCAEGLQDDSTVESGAVAVFCYLKQAALSHYASRKDEWLQEHLESNCQ